MRATLKGMALTFKHMFEPKVTMQYPEEKSTTDWSISQRWRGTHRMLTDEQGRSKCVACGLCPQICPANCIKLVPGEDEDGQPLPADLRDRRVPLRLLRLLPGGLSRGGDPRRACTSRTPSTAGAASCTTWSGSQSQTHAVSTLWDPTDPRGE